MPYWFNLQRCSWHFRDLTIYQATVVKTRTRRLFIQITIHLRNRKHFACFHTVIETRVVSHDVIQHWVWSIKLMILEYKSHLIWIRVIIHTTYAKKLINCWVCSDGALQLSKILQPDACFTSLFFSYTSQLCLYKRWKKFNDGHPNSS